MFIETVVSGMIDPFRIGLIVALYVTMLRTRQATGTLVPLAAGVLFVAVIIPVTMGGIGDPVPIAVRVLAGIVSNIVIVAVVAGLWMLWLRMRR